MRREHHHRSGSGNSGSNKKKTSGGGGSTRDLTAGLTSSSSDYHHGGGKQNKHHHHHHQSHHHHLYHQQYIKYVHGPCDIEGYYNLATSILPPILVRLILILFMTSLVVSIVLGVSFASSSNSQLASQNNVNDVGIAGLGGGGVGIGGGVNNGGCPRCQQQQNQQIQQQQQNHQQVQVQPQQVHQQVSNMGGVVSSSPPLVHNGNAAGGGNAAGYPTGNNNNVQNQGQQQYHGGSGNPPPAVYTNTPTHNHIPAVSSNQQPAAFSSGSSAHGNGAAQSVVTTEVRVTTDGTAFDHSSSQHIQPLQHVTTLDTEILAHNVVNGPNEIHIHYGEFHNGEGSMVASFSGGGGSGVQAHKTTLSSYATGQRGVQNNNRQQQKSQQESVYYDAASQAYVRLPSIQTPPTPRKIYPTLCPDGYTYGYSDWTTLRSAIMETNALSAESFLRWNEYHVAMNEYERYVVNRNDAASSSDNNNNGEHHHNEELIHEDMQMIPPVNPDRYYTDPLYSISTHFPLCPSSTLRTPRHNRRGSGPIFVNAEDIVIECDNCVVDVGGTHFAFGPHAKNVVVRGVTFMGAVSSSLTFHHHGAEASFEDCYWVGNAGSGSAGAVADLNSTSSVSFFRCEIADTKSVPRGGPGGQGAGVTSSLTIRN